MKKCVDLTSYSNHCYTKFGLGTQPFSSNLKFTLIYFFPSVTGRVSMSKYLLTTLLFNNQGLITCLHPIASALGKYGRPWSAFPAYFQ
jgi:hypothetical protein